MQECHQMGMRSLDDFFTASARRYPDRHALFVAGKYWSYQQLDDECKTIEHALRGRGRNIGVMYGRGAFSYAAVIAIMRSGNVYVPLNGALPAERLLTILQDASIETLIIDASAAPSEGVRLTLQSAASLQILVREQDVSEPFAALMASTSQHRIVKVGSPAAGLESGVDESELPRTSNLAYIIYTSGSTGVPKGVAITQESACRCIEKSHRLFATDERDRFTQFSALSFDVSILDLFLCWKSGAVLYVPAHHEAMLPLKFAVAHKITVWSSVPSLANFLLKMQLLKHDALASVRLFLFCGEALPAELAAACRNAAPRSRVFNLYGPTECTIFATCHEYQSADDEYGGIVPIGLPLAGVECKVVDDGRAVEADGEPGELWLAGEQLAVEYWRNSKATQAAFVQHKFDGSAAHTWYRTGDLVSWRRSVGLLFRGRLDRQVKLRGFRVELQEIESALREVVGCAVVAVVPVRSEGGICEKIIAYCDSLSADEATLKARCSKRLAQYMVPDRILELPEFPLSASGKIDYLALAKGFAACAAPMQ
jgi:D-alanine--poly(phosphoribitol) ligase subunit 1